MKAPSQVAFHEHLRARRPLHTAHVTLQGVELVVSYHATGTHLPETDIDDRCAPTAEVRDVLHNGGSILKLLSEDQLNEICEQIEGTL